MIFPHRLLAVGLEGDYLALRRYVMEESRGTICPVLVLCRLDKGAAGGKE